MATVLQCSDQHGRLWARVVETLCYFPWRDLCNLQLFRLRHLSQIGVKHGQFMVYGGNLGIIRCENSTNFCVNFVTIQ